MADEIDDARLRARAHARLLLHLLELGDIDAVERELEALQRLAETRNERYIKWVRASRRASYAHLGGRLEDCETLAHGALAHRLGELAAHVFEVQMVFVRCEQGRLDELVETVEGFAGQDPKFANWRCALAYIYTQLERREQARQELEALARADFSDLPRDMHWLSNLAELCPVVGFLGDAPRAQLLYELLSPYTDRCAVSFSGLTQGSVSRPLGLLATTLTRFQDGAQHFEQALKMNAQIRSPLWIAHTQHDYARMLLLRARPRDREKALELLKDALVTAEELGLKALADRARPLKLAAEAAGPPPALPRPA